MSHIFNSKSVNLWWITCPPSVSFYWAIFCFGYLFFGVTIGCVSEVLTAVSLLSSEAVFLQPHRDEEKQKASIAQRRFASKHGDLPTLINIYQSWLKVREISFVYFSLGVVS